MAIRFLKGKKSPYQVYWNNPFTGRRESACFAMEGDAKKHDALIKYRLKFEREMFRPSGEEDEDNTFTSHSLESVYYLYLKDRRFSIESLRRSTESMKQILEAIGATPIDSLNEDVLLSLKMSMMKSGIKGTSYRRRIASLKAVLNWTVQAGLMSGIPKFPPAPKVHYERHVPPTADEITALLSVAPPHVQRIIILGTQLGMRVGPSEMFRLEWNHVDFKGEIVRVPAAKKNLNEPWRDVPIRASLMPIFASWHNEDLKSGAHFIVHYEGRQVTSIKTAWNATLLRAGITRKIWPYDLRHAFATEALAADVDAGTVAKIMGHASTAMIFTHYQHVSGSQKRLAVERLPEVPYVHESMCTKKCGSLNEQ